MLITVSWDEIEAHFFYFPEQTLMQQSLEIARKQYICLVIRLLTKHFDRVSYRRLNLQRRIVANVAICQYTFERKRWHSVRLSSLLLAYQYILNHM